MKITDHPRAIVQITVDGIGLDSILRQRLVSLTHTDNRGFEADRVEITLDDSDGALDIPPRGAVVTVAFGWADTGLVPKGSFTVGGTSHEGPPDILTIRADSADLRAGLSTQRERSWHATTLGAIIKTIADENDLIPAVHASLAAEPIDHLDQTNESAANLITRLGERYDAVATVKDGRLLFIPAGGGVTARGKPIPSITIVRQSGDRHYFNIDDRQEYNGVRALYNDLAAATKGEIIWGNVEDSAERGNQPATAIPRPTAGQYKSLGKTYPTRAKAQRAAAAAWKTLKANKAQRASYVGVKAQYNDRNLSASGEVTYGQANDEKKQRSAQRKAAQDASKITGTANAFDHSADNIKTLRHVYASKANAQRAARAEWRRLQRGMANFSITLAKGMPELFTERPATVAGFKPQIDSTDWIITKVNDTINGDGGYTQSIELEIKATEIPD